MDLPDDVDGLRELVTHQRDELEALKQENLEVRTQPELSTMT